jgi:hypothetical protein
MLNTFFKNIKKGFFVSCSAFTKARKKLSYTAFIELNEKAIVEVTYANEHERFKGFKVKAIDGSVVLLPNEQKIREEFGTLIVKNQKENFQSEYTSSKVSVLYDVMNSIGINSVMGKCDACEINELLTHHTNYLDEEDLLLLDRAYPSYIVFAQLLNQCQFLARCSRASFKAAQELFSMETSEDFSVIKTLKPARNKVSKIRALGLPTQLDIRFVKIHKPNGRVYVLATSLLDQQCYPDEDFSMLYDLRWNIETFFDIIKNRLTLENFTGRTVESIYQDFFSTILITGLESILTQDAQDILEQKTSSNEQPQVVNKSVSFSAIKDHVIELFYSDRNDCELLNELTNIFLTRPRSLQKGRFVLRKKFKNNRKLFQFYKYRKKYSF